MNGGRGGGVYKLRQLEAHLTTAQPQLRVADPS